MLNKISTPWLVSGGLALLLIVVGLGALWRFSGLFTTVDDGQPSFRIVKQRELGYDPLVTPARLATAPPVYSSDPLLGVASAEVEVVEFGDFQCPYCATYDRSMRQVVARHPRLIKRVWKDLPSPAHPEAKPAAIAARCAQAQGNFWAYHDRLFENQDSLGQTLYLELAKELGFNTERFQQCLQDKTVVNLVDQGLSDAQQFGVDGTPFLFINGKPFSEVVEEGELEELVVRALPIRNP